MGRNPFAKPGTTSSSSPEQAPFPASTFDEAAQEIESARSHIADIPTADFHPKKRADKRQRGGVLFVRNLDDLRERLEQNAEKLGVPRDMLVRFLLERGLERHATGLDLLLPVLSQRLTLYPNDPPRARKRKGQTAKGMGFRGIPEETRTALTNLADDLGVPGWQVIRRLIENGLAAWEQGELEIKVHTVTTTDVTLYPERGNQVSLQ